MHPDVLCMQETKLTDCAFPAMAFPALGYDGVHDGEGRWNGVAISGARRHRRRPPGFHYDEPAAPKLGS